VRYHDRHFGTARAQDLRRPATRPRAVEPGELGRVLRAAAAGSESAWVWLLERFSARIRSVARSHRLASDDVDDVTQLTWLRLLEHAGSVRDPDHLAAWLSTVARREALRLAMAGCREELTGDQVVADQPVDTRPEERLLAAERTAALAEALDELPERHARLMRRLFEESQPSYSDIAASLDIPVGSIGPIRARSLKRLERSVALKSMVEAAG